MQRRWALILLIATRPPCDFLLLQVGVPAGPNVVVAARILTHTRETPLFVQSARTAEDLARTPSCVSGKDRAILSASIRSPILKEFYYKATGDGAPHLDAWPDGRPRERAVLRTTVSLTFAKTRAPSRPQSGYSWPHLSARLSMGRIFSARRNARGSDPPCAGANTERFYALSTTSAWQSIGSILRSSL